MLEKWRHDLTAAVDGESHDSMGVADKEDDFVPEVWVCDLQGGILLLTGPSGCGKTATVRVLSRELNIRIQEWTNYSNLESYGSSQYGRSSFHSPPFTARLQLSPSLSLCLFSRQSLE